MKHRAGSFAEFKHHTLAIVRGEWVPAPGEPKIWIEAPAGAGGRKVPVRFRSLEAGAKLLSVKNRLLMRAIARHRPQSVVELATLTGRAEQNVMRTLRKLSEAGLVRLDRGKGRAYRPVVAARRVHFEIDLLG
jgi:predicted transcriptional regulator